MFDFKELFFTKKMYKKRKWIYIPIFFIFLYLLLVIYAKNIETIITFPGVYINIINITQNKNASIDFEEINFIGSMGENINGLYVDNGTKKTVYYFYGKGGNLSYFYDEIKYIRNLGYNVMAYNYPGYGKSLGIPYSENIENSSLDFYKYLKNKKLLKDEDIIVWGCSIGTAVAVDFAKSNNIDKVVLVSPFSSRYDMSIAKIGFILQKLFLLPSTFDTESKVKNMKNPVLILHGNNDSVVPFWQGKKVFSNYLGENKFFIELDKGENMFVLNKYGDTLKSTFKQFLGEGKLGERYIFLDEYQSKLLKIDNKIKKKPTDLSVCSQIQSLQEKIVKMGFDISTDDSITRFVSNKISFYKKEYRPIDLVKISSDYVNYLKGDSFLREEANNHLQEMAKEFFNNFSEKMLVISAYRSYEYQVGIKKGGCSDIFCAKPGFSEHQSGLAVDLWDASSEEEFLANKKFTSYFMWMQENAYKYGFTNSYQKGIGIDGYVEEPWHWRYVGTNLATILWQNKETFTEFYNN